MNYDQKYEIRIASISDVEEIMSFINTYWKKGHILACNKSFFCYEHITEKERVNFILAIEKSTSNIAAILGFIPASHDKNRLDIWTGIWKAKTGVLPLLGMELYRRIQGMVGARSLLGVGDSQITTGQLLKKLTNNFKTWRMKHFYLLGKVNSFVLAKINKRADSFSVRVSNECTVHELCDIQQIKEFIDISNIENYPYKDLWYLNHRYYQHPIYKYNIFGIENKYGKALMVIRLQEYSISSAARIVDYIGNQNCFAEINAFLNNFMEINHCEYVDFYVYGFDEKYIHSAGFVERTENDINIIPNYFAPFKQNNIDIYVSSNVENVLFCKADGDQDRPNNIIF